MKWDQIWQIDTSDNFSGYQYVDSGGKIYNENTSNYSPLIYTENNSNNKVPNLRGKSLKEALEIANSNGIKLDPIGLNGKIVWQSLKPGSIINKKAICKVKLAI